jgi:FAD/FMN-containing dehydrogenase
MDDDGASVRANYGENYGRLAQIKRRYDPGNLFRLNAVIAPATGAPASGA